MTLITDLDRVPPITLGTRLRIAREWRGLSQDDLATVLGKTRQTISNYEREFTPIGKLELNAWAVTTDTDVDWLKTGVTTPLTDGGSTVEGHAIFETLDYGSQIPAPVTDIRSRIAA